MSGPLLGALKLGITAEILVIPVLKCVRMIAMLETSIWTIRTRLSNQPKARPELQMSEMRIKCLLAFLD